jgi:D-3-phosphoglycerate dehydrogenase / 2-oxoglutarate reductase
MNTNRRTLCPQPDLSQFKVVRLNSNISPVDEYEASLYLKHGIQPFLVEANTPEEIIPSVAECDAILVVSTALPAIVIESLARCRVISRLGIGIDKIAVKEASQHGILVTNVPGCFTEEVADHTLAFVLALARKFPQMKQAMVEGAWSRSRHISIHNHRLSRCTLGLVGFGDSARLVAQRAKAFGMRVIATRRNPQIASPEAEKLGVQIVDLDTLLAESDFVSLHLPLNPETYHLIERTRLNKMKPGAVLINTARGAIVDEAALVEALLTGHLAGAGLDTFEHIDPFTGIDAPQDHPLLHMNNVVLTPHVAALSEEGMREVSEGGIENLVAVLSGAWPAKERVVNPGIAPRFPLVHKTAHGRPG